MKIRELMSLSGSEHNLKWKGMRVRQVFRYNIYIGLHVNTQTVMYDHIVNAPFDKSKLYPHQTESKRSNLIATVCNSVYRVVTL
jgi:hypothetical protein